MIDFFNEPLEEYVKSSQEGFTNHWMANKFRNEYPSQIEKIIPE